MGNSTGSMFYAFGAFLLIYLVGVSIYQIYLWIKKWRENREEKAVSYTHLTLPTIYSV